MFCHLIGLVLTIGFRYLEGDHEEQHIKPWFWIALLLIGRLIREVADEWFMFTTVRPPRSSGDTATDKSVSRRERECAYKLL